MQANRKITRSEKKLFFIAGLAIVFIIAFGAWRQYVDAIPEVEIPTPKMPSPNAYDFYVKAGAAIIPANPSVDAIYERDATKVFPKAQWKTRYPTAKKEAWLRRNAKALKLLRQGFKYPCRVPPKRSSDDHSRKTRPNMRALARMLSVENHARSERGHWKGNIENTIDILKLGHDVSQGGTVDDCLIGAAINATGRRDLWEILPHLNAADAMAATRRLEKIIATRVSYADVLREEKYYIQEVISKVMHSWRATNLLRETDLPLKERWRNFATPRRVILNNYTNYMDSWIAYVRKPYNTKTFIPALPDDFVNQVWGHLFKRSYWNYTRDEVSNSLCLVALALRAYRMDHNRYPQKLNQLVPSYLKKIPIDPFGAGEPLHYKLAGREYSLYSIGPDGIDNGGRATENAKYPKGDYGHFLTSPESKGDFVAGINR